MYAHYLEETKTLTHENIIREFNDGYDPLKALEKIQCSLHAQILEYGNWDDKIIEDYFRLNEQLTGLFIGMSKLLKTD